MSWLASGLKQVFGLFVDDGWLSLAVCIWLLMAWFVLPHFVTNASARPIILFIGLALLLADSVRRALPSHSPEAK